MTDSTHVGDGADDRTFGPATLAVRTWDGTDRAHRTLNVPLHLSSVWEAENSRQLATLFNEEPDRGFYTRFGHPTLRVAERQLAAMEGAEDAVVFGSGMAAITASILATVQAGDHVVVHESVFGQTVQFLQHLERHYAVAVDFVDATNVDAVRRAVRPKTSLVYIETPSNPRIDIIDIGAVAAVSAEHGAPVFVDSTFGGPLLQHPIALGAGLALHSASKSLAGHADLLAGVAAGSRETIERVRRMRTLTGGVLDPHACWLLLRGIKTLPVRIEAQCRRAHALACLLQDHPVVSEVRYPFLPSHPGHAVAQRQMVAGGTVVSFALRDGLERARRFVAELQLVAQASSLGHVYTTIEIPEELDFGEHEIGIARSQAAGTPGLMRLSVGLEDLEDLETDIRRALDRVVAG